MPKLAITGKGGVGKTTLAALLAFLYASEGRNVLARSTPTRTLTLASALGIPPEVEKTITPIVEMEQLIARAYRHHARNLWRHFQDEPARG